jgi:hypothetical protein
MKDYAYSKYPKVIAYTETSSPRQVKRFRQKADEDFYDLTETERKQLRRSQFAFGTIYPYTFDGLAYIATHHKELSKEYGREIVTDAGDYHFQIKLPFNGFIHYCLLNWIDSKKYFKEELRRYISGFKTDEHKFFRYIPISKGNYVLTQPLIISFHYKDQSKMTVLEVQRLRQIDKLDEGAKVIQDIAILIAKPLLNSIMHKGVGSGWFSVPSALQAKIDIHLELNPNVKLTSLFLRKYYLYLNTLDSSNNKSSMIVDAVDLWEHISPSEVKITGKKYKYIANWEVAKSKLKSAHKFFQGLKGSGVLAGSKLQPATNTKFPDGLFAYQRTQQYKICYARSEKASITGYSRPFYNHRTKPT